MSARYLAALPVAIFPTTTSSKLNFSFTFLTTSATPLVCPCAVSITIASTPALYSASTRSKTSGVTPTAAATRSRPNLSLFELGFVVCFVISRNVIKPTSVLSLETTGSFSILCSCNINSASFKEVPSFAVIKFCDVITSLIGRRLFFSKRKSRFVTIPNNLLSSSTTGIPPIL